MATPTKYFRVDASTPLRFIQGGMPAVLAYNHLSSVPSNWVMDTSGDLRLLDPEGTLGPRVLTPPQPGTRDMPFWKQVLHAAPYAFALGGLGMIGGGIGAGVGAGTGAAEGGGLAGIEGGTAGLSSEALAGLGTGAMGAVPVGAGLAGTAGAGLGTAGATGAFDAAGNFIGPTTVTGYGTAGAGGSGIIPALSKGAALAKTGSSIWNSLSNAGADASALATGRADARQAEAAAQQRQDQLAIQRYQAGLQGAQTDLAQRRFGLEAPGQRAGNAVRGDILANAQDVSFSGLPDRLASKIPTISGGLRPSIFSPATRQLGGLMSSQALSGQQAGDNFAPIGQPPELTPLPSGNAFDTALTTGGTLATLGGQLGPTFLDYLSRYRKAVPPTYTPPTSFGDEPSDTAGWG